MKSILVFRHGKSDWGADYATDSERPLAKRGRSAARTMGTLLARIDQTPDLILSSTALRARETARLAREAGKWSCSLETTRELYEGSAGTLLGLIQQQRDEQERLLLAGHEPTSSELVSRLIGGGDIRFPTAALARVDFDVGRWIEVRPGGGTLVWLVVPRLLKSLGFKAG